MKRNMDLIRHILLTCEESEAHKLCVSDFSTEEYSQSAVSYHLQLLLDCDFIEALPVRCINSAYSDYIVVRLTMDGHEYLDSIRDPSIWSDVKKKLGNLLPSASMEVIQATATAVIKKMLGI